MHTPKQTYVRTHTQTQARTHTHAPVFALLSLDNSSAYHSAMSYCKGPCSNLILLAIALATDIDVVCVTVGSQVLMELLPLNVSSLQLRQSEHKTSRLEKK